MIGLKKIPNQRQLSKAYRALQFAPPLVQTKKLITWSQWTRLDPRLGEVLVEYLAKFWEKYNPIELNQELKKQVWPAVFGVLLQQVPFYYSTKKIKWNKELFALWLKCAMSDIPPANKELFFIGLYKPGGVLMKEECFSTIKAYLKWGYYSKALLINKAVAGKKTLIPPLQRKALIEELLKSRTTFTVKDYLEKINFQVPRRQAQRDLQNHKHLKAFGNTKNRYYQQKTGS